MTNLDQCVRWYVAAMLWAETDDDGTPLEANYGPEDITPDSMTRIKDDCAAFLARAADLIDPAQGTAYDYVGHDLWLTRNGHGAGFWDGDWGAAGDALSAIARTFPEVHPYVTDDGAIDLM